MSKEKRARALADNEAKAIAKMLRISPQKLNLVAGLIRGKKVASALADLQFSRKRIAVDVKKGDKVLYAKYAGTEFKIEGEELLIVSQKDILAVVQS